MNALLYHFILVLIRIRRDDIEDEDDQESYYNYMKNAPVVAYPDDEEELEYDSDGNPIAPEKSKVSESIQYTYQEKDLVSSSSIFKDYKQLEISLSHGQEKGYIKTGTQGSKKVDFLAGQVTDQE